DRIACYDKFFIVTPDLRPQSHVIHMIYDNEMFKYFRRSKDLH
ncbi:10607_t:CDS:1, partial [Gigaspora rosea]